MAFINGFVGLGTSIVSGSIVEPPSGTNYNRVMAYFDSSVSGIVLNVPTGQFGPVSGTWGTLTCFQVYDTLGNPAWVGTLNTPISPSNGQYVYFPAGQIQLNPIQAFTGSGVVFPGVLTNLNLSQSSAQPALPNTVARQFTTRFADEVNAADTLPLTTSGIDISQAINLIVGSGTTSIKGIWIPPGSYVASEPIVVNADSDFYIRSSRLGSVKITVNHTGVALTINQTNASGNVYIEGLRFLGSTTLTQPISGAIEVLLQGPIVVSGATPGAASPQQCIIRDCEVLAAFMPASFAPPYPGCFQNGLYVHAVTGTLCAFVRVLNCAFQISNTAAPAPTGFHAMKFGLVDDFQIERVTSSYADYDIYINDYCEGLRMHNITLVGSNVGIGTAPSGFSNPIQNSLYIQKIWMDDAEINTYYAGLQLSNVSNSFITDVECVRFLDSAKTGSGWAGLSLTNCFGWQCPNFYTDNLIGTPSAATGILLSVSGSAVPNTSHIFMGTSYARMNTPVHIKTGVSFCRFLHQFFLTASGLSPGYVDNSGNSTNIIQFESGFSAFASTAPFWLWANGSGQVGFSLQNVAGQDTALYVTPGAPNAPLTLMAQSVVSGSQMPIQVSSPFSIDNTLGINANVTVNQAGVAVSGANTYLLPAGYPSAVLVPDPTASGITIDLSNYSVTNTRIEFSATGPVSGLAFSTTVSGISIGRLFDYIDDLSPFTIQLLNSKWVLAP